MSVPKKLNGGGSLSSVLDGLTTVSFFIDGVVSASGVSIMVLQGKHVSFPNFTYLLAFQLCYVIPQLLTTAWVDDLCERVSARRVLLPATVLASMASAYVTLLSLSQGSLPLFFLSRAIGGFFRHPKTIFGAVWREAGVAAPSSNVAALTLPAMYAGFVSSGVLGDLWHDAVAVQQAFVYVQAFITLGAVALAVTAPTRQRPSSPGSASPATVSLRAAQAMVRSLPIGDSWGAWGLVMTVAALRFGAGLTQCMYPILMPSAYGLPYTVNGLYLVLQDLITPYVAVPVLTRMGPSAAKMSGALLVAGVWFVPTLVQRGAWVFFPAALVLVDIPTAILQVFLSGSVASLSRCPKAIRDGLSGGLLIYVLVAGKFFSAPLRLALVDALPGWSEPSHAVAVPAAVHVVVAVLTKKPYMGLVTAMACLAFMFSTPSLSFAGIVGEDL